MAYLGGMDRSDQWKFIEREAPSVGASTHAIQKWRDRQSVPHKYRMALLVQAAGMGFALSPEAFDPPRPRSTDDD